MPHYLMRFSYTPEAWARLIRKPEDRREVARAILEKLGGRLHGFWYGFGEHDGFVLIEAPSNIEAAAFSVGIAAGGALRSAETTPLLTVEDTPRAFVEFNVARNSADAMAIAEQRLERRRQRLERRGRSGPGGGRRSDAGARLDRDE